MQVGAVLVFDAGPLELRHGGIDIERVRAYTAARLSSAPRAQQRPIDLAFGPLPLALGRPLAWIDDPFFSLEYHVRHAALPRPGDERQLKRLAARIFSQSLDREKPPWELCFVEGLEDGRFALIAKVGTELAAGADGLDPLAALLSESAGEGVDAAPRAETRPTPGRLALMRAELARRAREITRPEALGAALGSGLRGALNALERALATADDVPLTGPAGPHRRIEWLALDDADLCAVAERLAATPHELLLATLAGALRVFLSRRGLEPDAHELRALTPICVDENDGAEAPLIALPVEEPDPLRRLDALRAVPEPAGRAGSGLDVLRDLADLHVAAAAGRPASLCVTDLCTTSAPLFLLGAPLRACIPIAPLIAGHSLGIAAIRRDGRATLGFTGDAALVTDLPLLADAVASAFDELRRLSSATVHPASPRADQSRVRNSRAEA